MNRARRVVSTLLENDDFDENEMLKHMDRVISKIANPPTFEANTTFARATSRAEIIASAGLDALRHLVPDKYDEIVAGYSDEIEALNRVLSTDNPSETDSYIVDEFAYEQLDRILDKFCKPFTYTGFHEGDGDYGCWINTRALEIAEEDGELVKFPAGSREAMSFLAGKLRVDARWVLIENERLGELGLWNARTGQPIWRG